MTSTPVGVATGVFGLIAGLAPSETDALEDTVYGGYYEMGGAESLFRRDPDIDRMEVDISYLEYTDYDIRFMSHIEVRRAHTDGGWIQV